MEPRCSQQGPAEGPSVGYGGHRCRGGSPARTPAVAEHEEFGENVITVETRDFFRPYPSHHNYHWNNNGETRFLIGDAMGKAMVKLLAE